MYQSGSVESDLNDLGHSFGLMQNLSLKCCFLLEPHFIAAMYLVHALGEERMVKFSNECSYYRTSSSPSAQ